MTALAAVAAFWTLAICGAFALLWLHDSRRILPKLGPLALFGVGLAGMVVSLVASLP